MIKLDWDLKRDRQIIESGHKTWDRSTIAVGTGNLISPGFWGRHVRAYNDTDANGIMKRPPGYLQNWDLDSVMFEGVSNRIIDKIKKSAVDEGVWVYKPHHYTESRVRAGWGYTRRVSQIIHGLIVTAYNDDYLWSVCTGPTYKSAWVVNFCIPVVSNNHPDQPVHHFSGGIFITKDGYEWQ